MPAAPTSQYSITEQRMHAVLTEQAPKNWTTTRVDWIYHRHEPPVAEH